MSVNGDSVTIDTGGKMLQASEAIAIGAGNGQDGYLVFAGSGIVTTDKGINISQSGRFATAAPPEC